MTARFTTYLNQAPIMQLKTLLLFTAATALATSVAVEPATERSLEIPAELSKRACTAGCACRKGIKAGLYCGPCLVSAGGSMDFAVVKGRSDTHVYQCGSNGSCCDYGVRDSCRKASSQCASGYSPGAP
ncbi:hypothetical protein V500_11037 [Pseudogymnoascus sp. VKM F-4518 (FW-2643)]|nr:hypothetical protein V500_11037 [Pseudogymnoascus sp. VKM F-4518 (FW-2643)]